MKTLYFIIVFLSFLTSCSNSSSTQEKRMRWDKIYGRREDLSPIYQVEVPDDWVKVSKNSNRADSRNALEEYSLQEGEELIRVTIHNFPTDSLEERILPSAQVARWKKQFDVLNPASIAIQNCSRGGFVGLFLKASGKIQGKEQALFAWSMQMGNDHLSSLFGSNHVLEEAYQKEMRADYTIKVVGSPQALHARQEEIMRFAKNFELIHEIPERR